jgi:ribosome-associated translation inhibitor RaiA
MHIEINSNDSISLSQELQQRISDSIMGELDRFADFFTRVQVHLKDENAGKSGPADKRCQIEVRLKHHEPLSVTHKADALDLAVDGAAAKMTHALDHLIGKLSS